MGAHRAHWWHTPSVMALMAMPLQSLCAEEVEAPEVQVIGHYETGIGTSDAASEGSVTWRRIESRPLLRPGELVELVPGQSTSSMVARSRDASTKSSSTKSSSTKSSSTKSSSTKSSSTKSSVKSPAKPG